MPVPHLQPAQCGDFLTQVLFGTANLQGIYQTLI